MGRAVTAWVLAALVLGSRLLVVVWIQRNEDGDRKSDSAGRRS